jgi:hypothetical protein
MHDFSLLRSHGYQHCPGIQEPMHRIFEDHLFLACNPASQKILLNFYNPLPPSVTISILHGVIIHWGVDIITAI